MFNKRHIAVILSMILAQNVTFANNGDSANPFAATAEALNLEETGLLYGGGALITPAVAFLVHSYARGNGYQHLLDEVDELTRSVLYRYGESIQRMEERLWLAENQGSRQALGEIADIVAREEAYISRLQQRIDIHQAKIQNSTANTREATLLRHKAKVEDLKVLLADSKEYLDDLERQFRESSRTSMTAEVKRSVERKLKETKVRFLNRAFKDGHISTQYRLQRGRILTRAGQVAGEAMDADYARAQAATEGRFSELWRQIHNVQSRVRNGRLLAYGVAIVGVGMIGYYLIDNNDVEVAEIMAIENDDERLARLESADDETLNKIIALVTGITSA